MSVLLLTLLFAQVGVPGVQFSIPPGLTDMTAYAGRPNDRFDVSVWQVIDFGSKGRKELRLADYRIMGNQAYGLWKNVGVWCDKRGLERVSMTRPVAGEFTAKIFVRQKPKSQPAKEPEYIKGESPAGPKNPVKRGS